MGKTITIRVDDETYDRIRSAADSERRSISNFMEYATMSYLEYSGFVTDEEMQEILEGTGWEVERFIPQEGKPTYVAIIRKTSR